MVRPKLYRYKQISTILFAIFAMIGCVAMTVSILADDEFAGNAAELEKKFSIYPKNEDFAKKLGIAIVTIYYGAFFLCNLFGLIGSYLEHFGMVATYVIQQIVILLLCIISACFTGTLWNILSIVWCAIITVTVLLYLRDLYLIRQELRKVFP